MRMLNGIDLDKLKESIGRPGKFEGETLATAYFYHAILDGNGEGVYFPVSDDEDDDDDDELELELIAELACVDFEESEEFNLPLGSWVAVHEDSNGFVTLLGPWDCNREEAEQKVLEWYGVSA